MNDRVRSLQIVWFIPAEPPAPFKLFEALVGQQPDAFQKMGPPQSPFPVVMESAVKNGVQHRLQSHSGRVDFFLEGVGGNPIAVLPEAAGVYLEFLRSKIEAAAPIVGKITRLAVVVTLARELEGLPDIAASFGGLFSNKLSLDGARDLNFQISRPTTVDGLDINRLLRWTGEVASFQQFVNGWPQNLLISTVDSYYLSRMLDVNTVPKDGELFGPELHGDIFAKLASVASSLIEVQRIEDIP